MSQREYHRALDNLQRLVVLRLFELHKLNISQTGKHFYHHEQLFVLIAIVLKVIGCAPTLLSPCKLVARPFRLL